MYLKIIRPLTKSLRLHKSGVASIMRKFQSRKRYTLRKYSRHSHKKTNEIIIIYILQTLRTPKQLQCHSIEYVSFILIYIYFYVTVDTACQALEQSLMYSKSNTSQPHCDQSGYASMTRELDCPTCWKICNYLHFSHERENKGLFKMRWTRFR